MKKEVKDIFQTSFEGYDSSVDTETLLAGIAAKRKKKKDRIGLWIFPVSIMMLGLIVMVLDGTVETTTSEIEVSIVDKTADGTEINPKINLKEKHIVETANFVQKKLEAGH